MGQVQEEQKRSLLQRPADLALIIYLILAGFFTLFRGLVSLANLPLSCLQPPSSAFPSHTRFFTQCRNATVLPSDHSGKFFTESDLSVSSQSPIPCRLLPSSNICGVSARGENQGWGDQSEECGAFLGEWVRLPVGGMFEVGCWFVCWLQVVLDCPTDACFVYIYQYEPYLRDPVAYPKVQVRGQVGGEEHGPAVRRVHWASLKQVPETQVKLVEAQMESLSY